MKSLEKVFLSFIINKIVLTCVLLLTVVIIYADTMFPTTLGKMILINPGQAATITISKTPYGKAPSGSDPNTSVVIPANGRVDIADVSATLSGEGYLDVQSNGDEPFALLTDGTKQVPGLRETYSGTFASVAPGGVNKLYIRADDDLTAQIVVEDRLGNVKSTMNSSFVAGSLSEPSVSIGKGDTIKVTFNGNGSALLLSDGEGYPLPRYITPTPSPTAQSIMNAIPAYSKLFRPSAEGEWIKANASWFVSSGYNGSASTLENALLRPTNGVMLGPVKSNGKEIGTKLAFWKNKQNKVVIGKVTNDKQAEQNAHNGYVAAAIASADAAPSSSEMWFAFSNVEALGAESTAARVTINGEKKAYIAPGRSHTLKLDTLGTNDVYTLESNGKILLTGRVIDGNIGPRDDLVPFDGDRTTPFYVVTGDNAPTPTFEAYDKDGNMLSSSSHPFTMGWHTMTLSELGLANVNGGSLRLRGNAVLVVNGIRAQAVTKAQQGALEVIVETPATANPILDQVVTTITVNDTRDGAEISQIAWDGDGDGEFKSTNYDKVWNYSGGNRNPPKTENITLCYMGQWSGLDTTRHLEVHGSYKDKDGMIKEYTYKKEFPLSLTDITTLDRDWVTDETKSAEVNDYTRANMDAIATEMSTGNAACSLSKENYLQALNYIVNCPDTVLRFNDILGPTSNNIIMYGCGNTGTTGCIDEGPEDILILRYAAWLKPVE
jgi:hypothetical protein